MSYPDVEFPTEFLDPRDISSSQAVIYKSICGRGGVESLNDDSKRFFAIGYREERSRVVAWLSGWKPYPERSWKWAYWHHCFSELMSVLAEAESRPDYVPLEDA